MVCVAWGLEFGVVMRSLAVLSSELGVSYADVGQPRVLLLVLRFRV